MFFLAANLINAAAVSIEFRLVLVKLLHLLIGNFHDFRSGKCHSTHNGNDYCGCLSAEILILAVAGVLVAFAVCIAVEHGNTYFNLIAELHKRKQIFCGLAKLTLELGNFCRQLLQRFVLFEPSFVAFKHIGEVPSKLFRNFASFQNIHFIPPYNLLPHHYTTRHGGMQEPAL